MKWFFVTMILMHGQMHGGQFGPWDTEAQCWRWHDEWAKQHGIVVPFPDSGQVTHGLKLLGAEGGEMGCKLMGEQ